MARGLRPSSGQHSPPLEVREMNERRYLQPLPEGRPRKREYFYAAIAAILMVAVHTADYPAAVVTEALVTENAQRECQSLKDGQWLRYMLKQRNHLGFEWHQCVYGPVWLEVANQNGH
jgi:hypothetical protein